MNEELEKKVDIELYEKKMMKENKDDSCLGDKFWTGFLCAFVFGLVGVVIGFTYQGEMRETFFYGFRKGLVVSFALIILALVIWLYWSHLVAGKP